MKFSSRGLIAVLATTGLLVAGCGSDTASTASSSATSAVSSATSSASTAGSSMSSSPASSSVSSSSSSSSSSTSAPSATSSSTGSAIAATPGTLIVFAAASLKATFTTLGDTFKAENPGSDITFNFAGSSDLVTQLSGGAPADVFASADTNNMTKATAAGVVAGTPVNFATNTLTIVTPPDNPAGITSFADLAKDGVSEVICAEAVPCGSAAKKVETATGVTLTPVSEEQSVTDVLNKVESGEADAGLVYVTDATNAGAKVKAIPFPEASGAVNTYPITVLEESTNAALAQAFVDLVTGPEGQAVLSAAGFAPAP